MQKENKNMDAGDAFFMKRALELAKNGTGHTSPNPMVGTVIVKDGKIIGEGFHQFYGGKHAEIVAIENASEAVEGATLYCNLEPCSHSLPEKKTPPCTLRIIKEKLGRVVIANRDPNPHVNGNGIQMLRDNGILVDIGTMEKEAAALNEKYYKFIRTGVPFVHLKIAQSLDGRIATTVGNSQWITNQNALERVHKLRSEYDAVLVGINTVIKDDPALTVRMVRGRNPYRIVLDDQLNIPDTAKLISDGLQNKTLILTVQPIDHPRARELSHKGVQVVSIVPDDEGRIDLTAALKHLADLRIESILVEGGGTVFTSFIRQKLFDKISFFIAPMIIGSGIESVGNLGIQAISDAYRLQHVSIEIIDRQAVVEGYREYEAIFPDQREDS